MKFLLAMLGGAAIGAGAALLLAPQSGSETRSLIKDKTTQCTDSLQEFAHETTMSLRNKLKGFRQDLDETIDEDTTTQYTGTTGDTVMTLGNA